MARGYMSGVGGGSGSDDCTATTGDVLAGATAIVKGSDDEPVLGTMPNRGAVSQVLNAGESYSIPQGYHNGSGKVAAKDLASQTPGNLAADRILANYYGYSNGVRVTGNIASQGAFTLYPGTTQKVGYVSGKYMTGDIAVPAVSIPAEWIKRGQRITFPDGSYVDGTFEGYVAFPTDLYNNGLNPGGFQNPLASNYGIVFESNMISTTNGSTNYCTLKTNRKYNFTPYSRINIEFMATRGTSGFAVGYTTSETNPMNSNDVTGTEKNWSLNSRVTVSQDISAYQGEAYVVIGEIFGYIYRVWFS